MPNITWEKSTPNNYDPSDQRTKWMDYVKDNPSPKNDGVWVAARGLNDLDYLIRKGVTNFVRGEFASYPLEQQMAYINAGRGIDAPPPFTQAQLGLVDTGVNQWVGPPGEAWNWPRIWNRRYFQTPDGATEPMSYEQAYQSGLNYPTTYNIIIFENSEQDHAVASNWNFWRGYYDAFMPRMEAKWGALGIKYYVAHNYFTGIGGASLRYSSAADAKAFFAKPVSQWTGDVINGGAVSGTNTVCFATYLAKPDSVPDLFYELIWAAGVAHKANKYLLVYAQHMHEDNPNNVQMIKLPPGQGTFYLDSKMPVEPMMAGTFAILSRIFADGYVPFDSQGKENDPFKFYKQYRNQQGTSLWFPEGSSTPGNIDQAPVWSTSGETFPARGTDDAVGFAMENYYDTFAQTKGGQRRWLEYRINNGEWIVPSNNNMDDVVDGQKQKKMLVFGETKGNQFSILALNPYGDPTMKVIDIKHPTTGTIWTGNYSSSNYKVAKVTES